MKRSVKVLCLSVALVAGCQAGGVPKAPGQLDLAAEVVRLDRPGPPTRPEGACWEKDVTPAVIETVTEQVLVTEEERDAAGQVVKPATYRTDTRARMVQDREEVWFRAPWSLNATCWSGVSIRNLIIVCPKSAATSAVS